LQRKHSPPSPLLPFTRSLNPTTRYFAEHNPPYPYYEGNASFGANGGVYNRIGRGIPDVSANGDNIAVFMNGNFTFSGGTSAATPIFASVINLVRPSPLPILTSEPLGYGCADTGQINEERLAIGKSPVGFINPVLYANPSVLNDITNGSNPNCGTAGFNAVPGW
jgi:tripeptidyl-peptidase-1